MCAETTVYNYVERLEVPKKWFKANVNAIMKIYGSKHRIQKEDLFLGGDFSSSVIWAHI